MRDDFDIERTIRDFHRLVQESRKLYDESAEIPSPFFKSKFGQNVALTSDGFNHLMNKPNRQPRNIREQRLKLRLLKPALQILRDTGTLQEYRVRLEKVGTAGKDGLHKTKSVEYWGFHDIRVLGEMKILIRVIVRRIGDGKFHFWSVMPIGQIGKQKFYRDTLDES